MTLRAACLLCLLLATAAQAGVYRWVDAQGKVHYTQTKPPDNSATEIAPAAPPPPPSAAQQRLQRLGTEMSRQSKERERSQAKDEATAQRQMVACSQARGHLATHNNYEGRIFTTDEQGNRHFLTAEENATRRAVLEKQVIDNCKE